jgi:hypothetical protein
MRMLVEVTVSVVVAVDGRDFDEACALAGKHVSRVLGTAGMSSADVVDAYVYAGGPPPEMKTITYTCNACNKTALKVDYGPGWIKCPHCGGIGTGITSA